MEEPRRHAPAPRGSAALQFVQAIHDLDTAHRQLKVTLADHLGLARTDYYALMFIAEQQTVTPKQLAASLNFTTGATTATIDRIENLGLVHRIPNPDDRRSVHLELTDSGIEASSWVAERYAEIARAALSLDREAANGTGTGTGTGTETRLHVLTHAAEAMTATDTAMRNSAPHTGPGPAGS